MTEEALKRIERLSDYLHSVQSEIGDGAPHSAKNVIEEALAHVCIIRTALAGEGWVRIEDIPEEWKDGRPVLLGNKHGTWVGHYRPVFTSGYRPDNPWCTLMLNHRHLEREHSTVPTHARALPEPPKEEPPHD